MASATGGRWAGRLAVLVAACAALLACSTEDATEFAWERRIRETGSTNAPFVVQVDREGNSYVVLNAWRSQEERAKGATPSFARVRKLDSDGRDVFRTELPSAEENANAVDLALDADGNVLVLGSGPSWLARLDADGELIAGPSPLAVRGRVHLLAAYDEGALVIAGTVSGEQPKYPRDIVVTMLAADGSESWTRTHDAGLQDDPACIVIGPEREIIVGGMVGDLPRDVWIQKYDAEGEELWAEPISFATDGEDVLADVVVFDDGSVLAVGSSQHCDSAYGPCSGWAQLYDRDGRARWPSPYTIGVSSRERPALVPEERTPYTAVDSVALLDGDTALISGMRGGELWWLVVENDATPPPSCPAEGQCDSLFVYQRSDLVPVHRRLRVDSEGHAILVGDATESEVEHYGFSPAGSLWIAKTRSPVLE